MKKIITLSATTLLFCTYLQFPSFAQNIESEIEINDKVTEIASESEEKKKRPSSSYTGLGGVIGINGDDTALGEGGFSILGRNAFGKNLSLHNSTIIQDDSLTLLAITYGIPIQNSTSERELFFPFIGGGIAMEDIFGDFDVDPLITTGVDVPIAKSLVGTVRVNAVFSEDDTDVGLLLGVGFRGRIF